jgi:exodeoxyribonuclease VII large subunit
MSPLKVLGRGYAIAQKENGEIIKGYQDIAAGDKVTVTLGKGGFAATVDSPLKEGQK